MQIILDILDFLFPPRPTELTIRRAHALPLTPGTFNSVTYLLDMRERRVQAAIIENKYHDNKRARHLLAQCLNKYKPEHEKIVYIPIPLSRARKRSRGYNQVEELLTESNGKILQSVLTRTIHTKPQTTLSKTERQKNVANAFTVINEKRLSSITNTTIILLDDVVTTGATLAAARATLAPHVHQSNTLHCLALAH